MEKRFSPALSLSHWELLSLGSEALGSSEKETFPYLFSDLIEGFENTSPWFDQPVDKSQVSMDRRHPPPRAGLQHGAVPRATSHQEEGTVGGGKSALSVGDICFAVGGGAVGEAGKGSDICKHDKLLKVIADQENKHN